MKVIKISLSGHTWIDDWLYENSKNEIWYEKCVEQVEKF